MTDEANSNAQQFGLCVIGAAGDDTPASQVSFAVDQDGVIPRPILLIPQNIDDDQSYLLQLAPDARSFTVRAGGVAGDVLARVAVQSERERQDLVTLLRFGEIYIHGAPHGLSEDHPLHRDRPLVCMIDDFEYWADVHARLDGVRGTDPAAAAEMTARLERTPAWRRYQDKRGELDGMMPGDTARDIAQGVLNPIGTDAAPIGDGGFADRVRKAGQ